MVYNMTIFCDTSCHQLCTVVLSFLPYTTGKQQNDMVRMPCAPGFIIVWSNHLRTSIWKHGPGIPE